MICQVQRWKDLDRWVPGGDSTWECLHTLVPLDDLLAPRTEHVRVKQTLGDWTPITIHFDGSVVPRERDTPFKGSMFAAYPGDLVFSKIDARNGAIGLIPDSMPKAVVTSEYWHESFPEDLIPDHEDPPYDRDRHLPKRDYRCGWQGGELGDKEERS